MYTCRSPNIEGEADSHYKKEVAGDSEGEGEELVYREAWSTGSVVQTGVAQPVGAAADLKAKGNAALEAGTCDLNIVKKSKGTVQIYHRTYCSWNTERCFSIIGWVYRSGCD